jgi:hypothetical protein
MVTVLVLLLVLVVFGGGIFVWYLYEQSNQPEAIRKWTDPKIRD